MGELIKLNEKYMFCFKCEEGNFYMESTNKKAIILFYGLKYKVNSFSKYLYDKKLINFNEKGVLNNENI